MAALQADSTKEPVEEDSPGKREAGYPFVEQARRNGGDEQTDGAVRCSGPFWVTAWGVGRQGRGEGAAWTWLGRWQPTQDVLTHRGRGEGKEQRRTTRPHLQSFH